MVFEIVYTPRAFRDLEAIEAYLTDRSHAGTRNVLAAIKRSVDGLADFPRIGTPIDNESRYRLPIGQYPYAIFYRVTETEVLILHIRHGARQPIEPQDL